MATSSVIISDLRMCLMDSNWDFDILNSFRGVQFLCKAVLASVTEEKAIFKVTASPCATLIEAGKRTFVLSTNLVDPLQATVISYDPMSGKLELSDFTYTSTTVGSRREFRVEPAGLMQITIETEGQTLTGRVGDVSMSGVGFYAETADIPAVKRGAQARISMQIPEGRVTLDAILRSIENMGKETRLAVEFTENVPEKILILHYINQRQTEIRNEVQQRYEALFLNDKS